VGAVIGHHCGDVGALGCQRPSSEHSPLGCSQNSVTTRNRGPFERSTYRLRRYGRAFDPAAIEYGTGIQGMKDRLAALGGALSVDSALGRGTAVADVLPVGS
jgi:signal transduction histidine kinase